MKSKLGMGLRRSLLVAGALLCTGSALRGQTNDLTLWYRKPAKTWTEALPVGNGRLGAMVFGGVERAPSSLEMEN